MSRDCSRAEGLVEKLFDGEASSAERGEAEAHLENCANCRSHLAHLEFLASIAEKARDRMPPEPPEAYWEHLPRRILGRIEEEGSSSRGWLRKLFPGGLRWAAPAVALFASLIVVVAVGTRFLRDRPGMGMSEPNARTEPRAPAEGLPASPMSREREEGQPSAPAESPSSSPSSSPSAAPSVSAPNARSEKAPPMARDEKPPASPAQSSENAEVRGAALGRMKDKAASPSGEAQRAAAPAAESPAPIASASTRQGGQASPALSVRERREANTPAREPQADSIALSQAGSFGEGDCSAFRDALSTWHAEADEDEGANETRKRDVQYQLARCSLDRYRRQRGEALRKAAIDDGVAFLASEKEGPRAEEIRADVERLRPGEKEN
jgi:Putative zinc-finger